ncbi:hypothetical protein DRQ50_12165 [bacterium]|nr:MAG: hypothetical protein DRQ50_12165 [bacterium]
MTRKSCFLLSLLLLTACAPQRPTDVDDEKVALLRIHRQDIQAHVEGNVDALLITIPDDMIVAGDGNVFHQSRDQVRQFFTGYLEGAEYSRYEDLMVPHVEVSDDGTMGWVISRTAVERTEPDGQGGRRERSFIYAGIMTYENHGDGWVKVANVSSFVKNGDETRQHLSP